MKRTARCLCGTVRFEIETGPEPEVGACHCGMCQKWAGSAGVALTVTPGTMVIEGEDNIGHYTSSDWAKRTFCRTCGSSLYYELTAPGPQQGTRYLLVGLIDDPTGLHLNLEIFHDRRSGVFTYADETKKMTEAEVMAATFGS